MVFEDEFIKVEREENELPWVKIFTKFPYRELSECDKKTRARLFEAMLITEKTMLEFYNPTKINIASFGNYVPHVHIHVIARFEDDVFFPESVWGKKQRESKLNLAKFDDFAKILSDSLKG
ncbi:HIT family protein [Campylobacter sp. RM9344]|uniref:HIT family protein n=1 Tax=Campylobacter californiensis TaxID=1032243 RepID=A0AAW3ZZA6_9BACT|nr:MULTISPECIES: HIT family protein [unclassified Campylobacter]MBE2985265.1 HIT family protein [Campylobacter sp. RM6883]MBE2995924.1 HIT family protein [Campylobacter sp. RM6913]MBE3030019.1 HIT family protein [Campylobacter sp. RM9344]MBE3608790.1 HIT family protein [Campylobacter sp. RM9337]QCD51265.1 HIT family protein [Campylobacter sp. RM6914]